MIADLIMWQHARSCRIIHPPRGKNIPCFHDGGGGVNYSATPKNVFWEQFQNIFFSNFFLQKYFFFQFLFPKPYFSRP